MRWGSADTFVSDNPWGFRMGRPIANEGFLRALLEYGSYDHYDIYCTDVNSLCAFDSWTQERLTDPAQRSRVQPLLHVALEGNLRDLDYDVFHFGDFTSLLPHMVEARNRLARRPFPITGITHSLDGLLMSTRYQQLVLSDLAPYDAVVCTSACAEETVRKGLDWARSSLQMSGEVSPVRLERVPLAIDEAMFQTPSRAEARARFELPEDVVIALCIGRVALRQKADWAPVLGQLARMRAAGGMDRLMLVIAGGGEDSDFALLDQLIQAYKLDDCVLCLPNFDAELKPYLYAAADFYFSLVDNFQETFGLTILEAMAAGLPVLCSEFNGYRELVEHGRTGLLVPTSWVSEVPSQFRATEGLVQDSLMRLYMAQMVAVDLEAFEESFRSMVADASARERMSKAARAHAARFTWRQIISEYEELWSRLREMALASSWKPRGGPMRLKQDPAHAYSHYASRLLGPATCMQITDLGRQVLADPATLVRYDDATVLLFDALERLLLSELCAGDRSIEALRSSALVTVEADSGLVDFHLMWLLKHGALRVKG
jgi:glycosyltransferase involved in cell wall biosynthesis